MDANELAAQICGCATPQQRKSDIAALLAFREAAVSEALTTAQAQAAAQEQRIAGLRESLGECSALLTRYRNETPVGHQPHMICHKADSALETARGALSEKTT